MKDTGPGRAAEVASVRATASKAQAALADADGYLQSIKDMAATARDRGFWSSGDLAEWSRVARNARESAGSALDTITAELRDELAKL